MIPGGRGSEGRERRGRGRKEGRDAIINDVVDIMADIPLCACGGGGHLTSIRTIVSSLTY